MVYFKRNYYRERIVFTKIKSWFSNYWYYYKWGVIIGGSIIAILLLCLVQCATKEKYDVNIMYTGPHIFEVNEKDNLSNAFEQIMNDYNGDGKTVADIMDMTAFTDEQIRAAVGENPEEELLIKYAPYTVDRVRKNFTSAISGDGYVCLIDEYWYDILKNNNAIVPLSEVLGYTPENIIDEYSVYLRDLEFYKFFADSVGKLPDDTIVCFRVMPTTSSLIGRKEAKAMYNYSIKLFRAMFAFDPEG